jgi:hypothetical protein
MALAAALLIEVAVDAQVGDLSRRRQVTTAPTSAPATQPLIRGPATFESPEHRFRVSYSDRWMTYMYDGKAGFLRLRPADVRRDEDRVVRPNWMVNAAPIAPVPQAERTLDGLVARRKANLKKGFPDAEFTDAVDTTVGGVPGKRFNYTGSFEGRQVRGEQTLAVKGDMVFFLVGFASALEYEVIAPEFEALRASFTWTDGETTTTKPTAATDN